MGWMKDGKGKWGDEPADYAGVALEKLLTKTERKKSGSPFSLPLKRRRELRRILLANKALRAKIDKAFLRVWGRKATDLEFRRHIEFVGAG